MYRFTSFINSKDGWKLERLAAFCDGVIAIVITLLVLGIEVPSVHSVTQEELGDYLLATCPVNHRIRCKFRYDRDVLVQHYTT